MSKIVEVHIVQLVGPSNLNRDESGSPKIAELGGTRIRYGSPGIKRNIRMGDEFRERMAEGIAERTKYIPSHVAELLVNGGRDPEEALLVASFVSGLVFHSKVEGVKLDRLIYITPIEVAAIAKIAKDCWEASLSEAKKWSTEKGKTSGEKDSKSNGKKRKDKDEYRAKDEVLQAEIEALQKSVLPTTPDEAAFGRMLTSLDAWNIDGASYFAHAIGTHNTYIQDDYWTAVDDRSPAENPGAGMLGTAGFVAGCIYRYFAFDVEQMRTNLLRGRQEGPELDDLVRRTVEALVWAGIGWPTKDTAKQHSLATFERPACVLLVMRDHGTPLSLFSAFDPGVVQDRGEGLVAASVRALDRQWGRVTLAYEEERSNLIAAFCTTDNLVNLKDPQVESNGKLASILRAWLEG